MAIPRYVEVAFQLVLDWHYRHSLLVLALSPSSRPNPASVATIRATPPREQLYILSARNSNY